MADKPLAGIRVIDLTRVLSGPFCTLILKNLGAEVIKVERPDIGDEGRFIGPFFGEGGRKSAYFMSVNAGKKSLALQLKGERGREIMARLVAKADVLVENFRPGVLARLGFPPARLRELNPSLVVASVSGFGATGPDSHRPAFDMNIQALSGIISITGPDGGPTTRVGTSISDIIAGMYAAIGIVAELYRRRRTAVPARVDVAMLDSTVAILENAIVRYQATGAVPGPIGTRHPSATPFGSFRTADAEVVITAWTDGFFRDLCDLFGRPELKDDPRFMTNALRTEHVRELTAIIDGVMSRHPTDWWLEKLAAAGIPCARVNTVADLFQYEQLAARRMLLPVAGEAPFRIAGNPIKLEGVPEDETAGAYPGLGQHTDEILAGLLGYAPDEIAALHAVQAVSKES
jgi:CoA:oxalate CoA-transferase